VKAWYSKNPALLQEIKTQIEAAYPELHLSVEGGIVRVQGSLFIRNPTTHEEIDRFSIEIEFPEDFPASIPIVRETAGRIPRLPDRHFNGEDACLFVPDERYKYYPRDATIVDFIQGPVTKFFAWQISYDLHGGLDRIGHRAHGTPGIIEFYSEVLQTDDVNVIIRFLTFLSKDEIKGHWECYCGSGRILRKCHFELLKGWRQMILEKYAASSLRRIQEHVIHNQGIQSGASERVPDLPGR
jgi:hypothetical protein